MWSPPPFWQRWLRVSHASPPPFWLPWLWASALDDEVIVNGHSLPSQDLLGLCNLTIVGKIVGRGHRLIVLHLDMTWQLCDRLLIFLRALATSAGLRDQSYPPFHLFWGLRFDLDDSRSPFRAIHFDVLRLVINSLLRGGWRCLACCCELSCQQGGVILSSVLWSTCDTTVRTVDSYALYILYCLTHMYCTYRYTLYIPCFPVHTRTLSTPHIILYTVRHLTQTSLLFTSDHILILTECSLMWT